VLARGHQPGQLIEHAGSDDHVIRPLAADRDPGGGH
jgi:hypothetical protein